MDCHMACAYPFGPMAPMSFENAKPYLHKF